jgi:hypothetical protein
VDGIYLFSVYILHEISDFSAIIFWKKTLPKKLMEHVSGNIVNYFLLEYILTDIFVPVI